MSEATQDAPGRQPAIPATPATGLRVLVPLDDSPEALRALRYALALASTTNGQLKLIRASDIEDPNDVTSLANYGHLLQEAGNAVEWSVAKDVDASTAILDAARTWQPDLIVMATTVSSDRE